MSNYIYTQPNDILRIIFTYLPNKDLLNIRQICQIFKKQSYNISVIFHRISVKNAYIMIILNIYKDLKFHIIANDIVNNMEIQILQKYIISLDLRYNNLITDEGIKNLINLTSLNLNCNELITDEGIKNLINITSLNIRYNNLITDKMKKELKATGIKLIY